MKSYVIASAMILTAAAALPGCATLDDDSAASQTIRGGWYAGYYYPGRGFSVYDKWGRSRPWRAHERAYWTAQRKREAAKTS